MAISGQVQMAASGQTHLSADRPTSPAVSSMAARMLTKAGKPAKTPMFIHRADGEMLAVAGLWATWRDPAAGPDAPWTSITTSPAPGGGRRHPW